MMYATRYGLWTILVLAAAVALSQAAVAEPPTDGQIAAKIGEELTDDPGVEGARIEIDAEDGVVTLSGSVNNILAHDRAARVARTARGVRVVVNELEVRSTDRADAEIRDAVEDALLFDPTTESFTVDVAVADGIVTLSGSVASWPERQIAETVTKGVRGVRGVDNDLAIRVESERLDTEIHEEVVRRLRWDTLVDDGLIQISVRDGVVSLAGSVGSAAERQRAVSDAWVRGVEDVDARQLDVTVWARDPRMRDRKYVDKPDEEIERAVRDGLRHASRVRESAVAVEADSGVATLTGTLGYLEAKRDAASVARNTVGVWRVVNRIAVRPAVEDDVVAERVRQRLREDPYVGAFGVEVEVEDGRARLRGQVDSYFERAQAEDVAAGVAGVAVVDNLLSVERDYELLTFDPHVDVDWYVYDYDWYSYPSFATTRSDWEIMEDIRDELWWSPFVDSAEISVAVDDGVATLTGTVETWSERAAATERAYEAGAVIVDNDLAVAHGPAYYSP